VCSKLDDRLGEAAAWDSLGYVHRHLGGYREAIACYRRASDLTDQLGARFNQADALIHLGEAYRASSAAANRTCSRRPRSSVASPPSSGYLISRRYRGSHQPNSGNPSR
jgi:tetratricopeptide (TPR) repeat protein